MAAALDALVPEAEQTARRKILASGVVSPCPRASRVNRPAVIEDPDIFRAAKLLIDQRGNRSRFDLNRDARRGRRGRTLAGARAALTLSGSPPHQA
jgi:hypothetical protein